MGWLQSWAECRIVHCILKWCHSQSDFTDHMSDRAKARKPWGKYTLKTEQFPLDHTPDAQHLLRMTSLSLVKWKHFVNCFGLFWSRKQWIPLFSFNPPPDSCPLFCNLFNFHINWDVFSLLDSGAEDCFAWYLSLLPLHTVTALGLLCFLQKKTEGSVGRYEESEG